MTVPITKVTHHEPPTCPAFLSLIQAYADLRTIQLALAKQQHAVAVAITRVERTAS